MKIHPILFAIFPVLIIYSQNIGRVNYEELFLPIIIVTGISVASYFCLRLIFKNGNKAAIVVTLILILIFSYGHIYILLDGVSTDEIDLSRNIFLIPVFGIIFVVGIYLIRKIKTKLNNANSILNVISVVLVLFAISNSVITTIEGTNCDEQNMIDITCSDKELFYEKKDFSQYFDKHKFTISDTETPPDVYYIILIMMSL